MQSSHALYNGVAPDAEPAPNPPAKKRFLAWFLTGKVLVISILLHVLGGVGATYWVVQTLQPKRKVTFQGAPSSPSASSRSMEHKVSMARKQQTMSAPVQPKRIASSGLSSITLPPMPEMPNMEMNFAPGKMAGMGGSGVGIGPASGMGAGQGMGSGSGNGIGLGKGGSFGFTARKGGMLAGKFYDLKQLSGKKTSGVTPDTYGDVVREFLQANWNESVLAKYYKAPKSLYLSQVYIPIIPATEAPDAYGVGRSVEPKCWVALYKGTVAAPYTDNIRFWGYADDVMLVRVGEQVVLNGSRFDTQSKLQMPKELTQVSRYTCGNGALVNGPWIQVTAGKPLDVQVLIGERPGGAFCAFLALERQSTPPKPGPDGRPLFDLFRLANAEIDVVPEANKLGVVNDKAPVWQGVAKVGGGLDYDRLGIQR
jgi:hypothetical protein